MQKNSFFVLQVKYPSFLSNRNPSYCVSSAWMGSSRYEFSRKSLDSTPGRCFSPQVMCPSLLIERNRTYALVACAEKVRG
jgi:hypothetical protein